MTKLIVSISVYEELNVLKEQIANIKYFSKDFNEVTIIYNCSSLMYKILTNENIIDDKIKIIINPDIINKKRFTGLIHAGFLSNLKYIFHNDITFDYFLVLSARTALCDNINDHNIKRYMETTNSNLKHIAATKKKFFYNSNFYKFKICDGTYLQGYESYIDKPLNTPQWFFGRPSLNNKEWFKKFLNDFSIIFGGKHEGLCFTYNTCKKYVNYFEVNKHLEFDMKTSPHCVEEIVPLTFGYNFKDNADDLSCTFLPNIKVIGRSNKLRYFSKLKSIHKYNSHHLNNNVNENIQVHKTVDIIEKSDDVNTNKIYSICDRMLLINNEYTNYFLDKIQLSENMKVLMINNHLIKNENAFNNSASLLSLNLRNKLGSNFVDYPKNKSIYKNNNTSFKITCENNNIQNLLDDTNINRDNILQRIANKEFDYVVYACMGYNERKIGDIRKHAHCWELVNNHYDNNHIVFLYGSDKMICKSYVKNYGHLKYHSNHGYCFVKKLGF